MGLERDNKKQLCDYKIYGCDFQGTLPEVKEHIANSKAEHLMLALESHKKLELKCQWLSGYCEAMKNQLSVMNDQYMKQEKELTDIIQKVVCLEGMVTKQESKNIVIEEELKRVEEVTGASRIEDGIMKMEDDLHQMAMESELEECKQVVLESQKLCDRVKDKVARMETEDRIIGIDIEEMRTKLSQMGTQLGIHDVRLTEQDLRFEVLETPNVNDGLLIMKIEDYTRRKHEAVVGKTLSLYSQPFYTSRCGYKMCARVYLNGDGIGEGTHMSLFFVVMRGEYDDFPEVAWPFSHEVTFTLLAHNAQRHLNISEIMIPDPTSTSFRKPTDDMNVAAGCPLFVSQADVEKPTYVKDDTLFIKVSFAAKPLFFSNSRIYL